MSITATLANGYTFGRPEGRESHPMDLVIERAIESLPAQVRLYPDIYSWKVTDAIRQACTDRGTDAE